MATLLLILSAVCLFCLTLGLVNPKWLANKGEVPSRGELLKNLGVCAIIFGITGSIFYSPDKKNTSEATSTSSAVNTPSETTAEHADNTPEGNLRRQLNAIRNISVGYITKQPSGKYRILTLYAPEKYYGGQSYVFDLAESTLKQGSLIKKSGLPVEEFGVQGMIDTVDNYGNESKKKGIVLTFPEEDFSNMQWDKAYFFNALEVADAYMKPLGRKAARDFCNSAKNHESAHHFCTAARDSTKKVALSVRLAGHTESRKPSVATGSSDFPSKKNQEIEKGPSPMNLDFNTFKKRVNTDLAQLPGKLRIPSSTKLAGDKSSINKVANISLNNGLSTLVSADPKTGKIVSILSIMGKQEDEESTINNVLAALAITSAPAGKDGEKKVGGEIMRMFNRVMNNVNSPENTSGNAKESFVRDNIRYEVKIDRALGFWFSAESADQKP